MTSSAEGDKAPTVEFRCPLCRCRAYEHHTVPSTKGGHRKTGVFRCGGCSVTFADPVAFTAFDPNYPTSRYAADPTRLWPKPER